MPGFKINRVLMIVLDSVGVGELPDAVNYGDCGSNTLGNCSLAVGGLDLPHLARLGLGNIIMVKGVPPAAVSAGAYGKMASCSPGKDTTTGHWELAGVILDQPFPVYPEGFPPEVIEPFQERIGRQVLGNKVASGTVIIEELGARHLETGFPIVYTSADSVFQIAAHEGIIPPEELYAMCRTAREILTGPHAVGRVIARPFEGQPGSFQRTPRRHDFSLEPVKTTVLDRLKEEGREVIAVGKIEDIFAGRGITRSLHTTSNDQGIETTLDLLREDSSGLVFVNLVDFDMLYGHRNNPWGYAAALEAFDVRLPEIMAALREDDVLIITADHGTDPTTESTDHSREYVPLLVYGRKVAAGVNLGVRSTFADVAATLAELLGVSFATGTSFVGQLFDGR